MEHSVGRRVDGARGRLGFLGLEVEEEGVEELVVLRSLAVAG